MTLTYILLNHKKKKNTLNVVHVLNVCEKITVRKLIPNCCFQLFDH